MSIEIKNIVEDCVREIIPKLTRKCMGGSRQVHRKELIEPATLDEILSDVVGRLGCELPDRGKFECENAVFKDHTYHSKSFHLIKVRYKVLTLDYYSTFYETDIYLSDDELRLFGSEGFGYFDRVSKSLTNEGLSALESIFTKLVRVYSDILSYIEYEGLESGSCLLVKRPLTKNVGYSPRTEIVPTSELTLATLVRSSCEGLTVESLESGDLLKASWECLAGIEG